ncbi:hypothetical protein A2837_01190 [Candidatus Kaiserbacteria bacterium RIFCSPHIGHO2_01_FULL_46_22]|uniref:Uncharacterized protein n=1 Tax=Candidatus Kaiserbacteria bacterium RIFCSPHIGHO2_01_FULL_46_22 TaxID=1798475 RepID=A0A1F6BY21_9BACT|nr:MAG: hypothetical protein A2837_01190 [Candidatus Kaiserbacteria bacterium RIFCSPHIGHO2_01_FULL_46_22]
MKAKNISTKPRVTKTTSARIATPSLVIKQHEQAILVVLAYLIGFITAFIAFKLAEDNSWSPIVEAERSQYEMMSNLEVLVKGGNLYAARNGIEHALSVYADREEEEDGFHYSVLVASVSPDNRFVHYCVQPTATSDTCTNFIYSSEEDVIYRVKNGEEQMSVLADLTTDSGWMEDGKLSLPGHQSVSADTPWKMVAH